MEQPADLTRTLCGLGGDRDLADSALACLAHFLASPISSVSSRDCELAGRVAARAGEPGLQGLTAILNTKPDTLSRELLLNLFPACDVSGLTMCDQLPDTARRGLVRLAATIHCSLADSVLLQRTTSFTLRCLAQDSDWEVKLFSLQYWRAVHNRAAALHPEAALLHLATHHFFPALRLGCQDYELSVNQQYYEFVKSLDLSHISANAVVNLVEDDHVRVTSEDVTSSDRHRAGDGDDLDNEEDISDLLEESDRSLVAELRVRPSVNNSVSSGVTNCVTNSVTSGVSLPACSLQEWLQWRATLQQPDQEVSAAQQLQDLLDTILLSCSDQSLLDLVDCY